MPTWREILTYLMFVVLATIIWFGRSLRAEHDTKVPVKVQYIGVPGSVNFSEPLPQTVQVTIRDAGARLRVYHSKPLSIAIDLTGHFVSKSGEVQISSDLLRTAISRQLQGTTALQSVEPEQIHTTYYTQQHKTVPIVLRHHIRCAPEYQLCGEPQLLLTRLTAYGTAQALDTLTSIPTQVLALSDVSDSADYTVGLMPPKGIRLSHATAQVRVRTERFTERVVVLPLRTEQVPEGHTMRLFPQQVRVTMRVGVGQWDKVRDEDIEAYCVYSDSLELLPVQLRTANPYITTMRAKPDVVEYMLEK